MLMEMLLFTITLSTPVISYRFVLYIQVVNDTEYFLEKKNNLVLFKLQKITGSNMFNGNHIYKMTSSCQSMPYKRLQTWTPGK